MLLPFILSALGLSYLSDESSEEEEKIIQYILSMEITGHTEELINEFGEAWAMERFWQLLGLYMAGDHPVKKKEFKDWFEGSVGHQYWLHLSNTFGYCNSNSLYIGDNSIIFEERLMLCGNIEKPASSNWIDEYIADIRTFRDHVPAYDIRNFRACLASTDLDNVASKLGKKVNRFVQYVFRDTEFPLEHTDTICFGDWFVQECSLYLGGNYRSWLKDFEIRINKTDEPDVEETLEDWANSNVIPEKHRQRPHKQGDLNYGCWPWIHESNIIERRFTDYIKSSSLRYVRGFCNLPDPDPISSNEIAFHLTGEFTAKRQMHREDRYRINEWDNYVCDFGYTAPPRSPDVEFWVRLNTHTGDPSEMKGESLYWFPLGCKSEKNSVLSQDAVLILNEICSLLQISRSFMKDARIRTFMQGMLELCIVKDALKRLNH